MVLEIFQFQFCKAPIAPGPQLPAPTGSQSLPAPAETATGQLITRFPKIPEAKEQERLLLKWESRALFLPLPKTLLRQHILTNGLPKAGEYATPAAETAPSLGRFIAKEAITPRFLIMNAPRAALRSQQLRKTAQKTLAVIRGL